MIGIYLIENDSNHKKYIGQSKNIKDRWRRHQDGLRNGRHENRYMQRAYNLGQTFSYSVLEECQESELNEMERKWIAHFQSNDYKKGYNLDDGGNAGKTFSAQNLALRRGKESPNYGRKASQKTKEKQRQAALGKNNKLSLSDVEQIKVDFLNGATIRQLAEQHGVRVSTIGKITTCKNWVWVLPELNEKIATKISNDRKQLIKDVENSYKAGKSMKEICREYDITYAVVHKILGNVYMFSKDVRRGVAEDFKAGLGKAEILNKYGISSTTYVRFTSELYNEREIELKIRAREMRAAGIKVQDIAKELGKHRTTITEWTHG